MDVPLSSFDYESDFVNLSTDATETLNNGEVIGLNFEIVYKKSFSYMPKFMKMDVHLK